MEIGKRIKKIRTEKALKQEDFGVALGVNRSVISRLESGRQLIDQDLLSNLWNQFQISPHWVITGENLGDVGEVSRLKSDLETTKELLAAKTEIIQLLKKTAGLI